MLKKLLPFLAWFDRYTLDILKRDLSGGVTVALVLIPQSMAYAQLAGLPIQAGLYASLLPPVIAVLFGSSWQLATGPVERQAKTELQSRWDRVMENYH